MQSGILEYPYIYLLLSPGDYIHSNTQLIILAKSYKEYQRISLSIQIEFYRDISLLYEARLSPSIPLGISDISPPSQNISLLFLLSI
jgi:hypothetical protein